MTSTESERVSEMGHGLDSAERVAQLIKDRPRPYEELLRVYQDQPAARCAVARLMAALLKCRRPTVLEYVQLLIVLSAPDPAHPCGGDPSSSTLERLVPRPAGARDA